LDFEDSIFYGRSTFYVVYNDKMKEQKMLLAGSGQEEKVSCTGVRMLKATGELQLLVKEINTCNAMFGTYILDT
jgi:hypothetical protein